MDQLRPVVRNLANGGGVPNVMGHDRSIEGATILFGNILMREVRY